MKRTQRPNNSMSWGAEEAKAILAKVEVLTVDSAADELLAGHLMRRGDDEAVRITPNLRLVIRDVTHNARRTFRKPETADDYLQKLVDTLFLDNKSIMQSIEHSLVWKATFERYIQDIENRVGVRVRNVRAAKHRHKSYAKPRGRFVLYLDAFIMVAEHMAAYLSGAEREGAARFLNFLDEESAMQAAMLADASDEGLLFTRLLDQEDTDMAELQSIAEHFVQKLEHLFIKGECMSLPGYTQYMATNLKQVRLLHLPGGRLKSLGGEQCPRPATIKACLTRTQNYTKLAIAVTKAEFPSYDICNAFRVFDLKGAPKVGRPNNSLSWAGPLGWVLPPAWELSFDRLSMFYKVDRADLVSQFMEHHQIAAQAASAGSNNVAAWQDAVRKTQGWHTTKKRHPAGALAHVLQRYIVYTVSTAKVEQSFSVLKRIFGELGLRSSKATEGLVAKLALDRCAPAVNEVIERAQVPRK